MKKSDVCALLSRLGLRPSRRLGQNFLLDQNLLAALLRAAAPTPGEEILEIGSGTGILTAALLAAGAEVTAVEIDHRLAEYLREKYRDCRNFRLLQGDACRMDYDLLFASRPYRCLANLPYSCGSVFLSEISAVANPPQALYVLLQKEMGERLTAAVGSKAYGLLTVQLSWRYQIKILRVIAPEVFFPPPAVSSVYLELILRESPPSRELCARASRLTACAFSQRRKKALGLLQKLFSLSDLRSAFTALGLSPDARAEDWAPEVFLNLAALLPVLPEPTIRKDDV